MCLNKFSQTVQQEIRMWTTEETMHVNVDNTVNTDCNYRKLVNYQVCSKRTHFLWRREVIEDTTYRINTADKKKSIIGFKI